MLSAQSRCCFYCNYQLNDTIYWDHLIPFSIAGNHTPFVATCSKCNSIKGSLVFEDLEEAITYVRYRRIEKGLDNAKRTEISQDMLELLKSFRIEKAPCKVLLPKVQIREMEPEVSTKKKEVIKIRRRRERKPFSKETLRDKYFDNYTNERWG